MDKHFRNINNILKKIIKDISFYFLIICLALYVYVFYRAEIIHEGKQENYYEIYYIISFVLILFSILFFFLKKKLKLKIFKIIIFLFLLFFSAEAVLNINYHLGVNFMYKELNASLNKKKKINKLSGIELFKKNRENYYSVLVSTGYLLDKNIYNNELNFLPLTMPANENFFHVGNDFYSQLDYRTDQFGFRNSNNEWNKDKIEFLLVGDSFLMGGDKNNSISANFKKLSKSDYGTINFSQGGIGTLSQYAILREYLIKDKFKNVILFYFEPNDLTNLQNELNHPILKNYLNDKNFSQNLIENQNRVDEFWKYIFSKKEDTLTNEILFNTNKEIKDRLRIHKFELLKFLKLYKLRSLLIGNNNQKLIAEFKEILNEIKILSEVNNSKFYFVYVPGVNRYLYGINIYNSSRYYSKIIEIVKELKINLIDLNSELFKKSSDPLINYLYRVTTHPSDIGHENISKYIYNKLNN